MIAPFCMLSVETVTAEFTQGLMTFLRHVLQLRPQVALLVAVTDILFSAPA